MNQVHFVLQGKGGVGKSLIAALIIQHQRQSNNNLLSIDTDPVNASLSCYKSLKTTHLPLLNGSQIDERQFDKLVELLLTKKINAVVDTGASSFIPLSNYIIENELCQLLKESGREVLIHVPVTGGPALEETLTGFVAISEQLKAPVCVWVNEYFGPVSGERDGKTVEFEEMQAYLDNKTNVAGIIRLAKQSALTATDFQELLKNHHTFEEAQTSDSYNFMEKRRLALLKTRLWAQLDAVLNQQKAEGPAS